MKERGNHRAPFSFAKNAPRSILGEHVNQDHFVYVIGSAGKPLRYPPKGTKHYAKTCVDSGPPKNAFHSITVDGRSTFSFRTNSVAMIDEPPKS